MRSFFSSKIRTPEQSSNGKPTLPTTPARLRPLGSRYCSGFVPIIQPAARRHKHSLANEYTFTMSDDKSRQSSSSVRKRLIAFIALGFLLVAFAPEIPGLFARLHLGSSRFCTHTEWRLLIVGSILIVAPAWVLFKFRKGDS